VETTSCWAIRPDYLRTISHVFTDGPSPALTARASQLLGRDISADDLRAALLEDFAAGDAAEEIEAVQRGRVAAVKGATAVISLQGVIRPGASLLAMLFGGGGGLKMFRAQLREAIEDDDVAQILINVNSPGGSVELVPETATEIRELGKIKPIHAIANTDAASAAYWLASQASGEFIVTPSGQVGAIGVFTQHVDWSKWNENFGIDPTFIFAGKYKVEGNPEEPLSDEAREAAQSRIDTWYAMFVGDVAKGRGVTATVAKKNFGEGRMLLAGDALEAGMVDRVESFEAARTRLTGAKTRRSARAEGVSEELSEAAMKVRKSMLEDTLGATAPSTEGDKNA
jgi:signal peptide peptidase SppA